MLEPETENVIGLQFSIMGPDEIRKRSVVEITKHDTYDKDSPVIKGLFDIRMGTTDMGKLCGTCNKTIWFVRVILDILNLQNRFFIIIL